MRRVGRVRRFLGDRRGVAALEFALVSPMLFALIFTTIEAGCTMVQTIMLDRALDRTVRSLRIGAMPNPNQDSMKAAVCADAYVLADCLNMLTLELVPIPDNATAANYPSDSARCINRTTPVKPVLRFDAGLRSHTVFVRACFIVEPLTPGLGLGLALPKDESGALRIIAKSGFVNEPP